MHFSSPDLKISYLMVRTEMQYFHIRFNMRAFPAWLLDEGLQKKVGQIQKEGEEKYSGAHVLLDSTQLQSSRLAAPSSFPSLNRKQRATLEVLKEQGKKKFTNSFTPPVQVTAVVAASKAQASLALFMQPYPNVPLWEKLSNSNPRFPCQPRNGGVCYLCTSETHPDALVLLKQTHSSCHPLVVRVISFGGC